MVVNGRAVHAAGYAALKAILAAHGGYRQAGFYHSRATGLQTVFTTNAACPG
jgi:hypothetical protein